MKMTYSLDLDIKKPAKGDPPGPINARIYIKTCTEGKYITPVCINMDA